MTTRWWHWALGTYLIFTIWLLGSAALYALMTALITPTGAWQQLAIDLSGFLPLFVATPLIWHYIMKRDVRLLVNFDGRINYPRIAAGFGIWFVISLVSSIVDYALNADAYRWTFSLQAFLPFVAVVLLLLPLQTSAEELLFRGWLLQWAHAWSGPARAVLSGALFALPHIGNPEAVGQEVVALLVWFILGAGWAFVSIRDNGIELALGAHFANNVFSLVIVGYDNAALPTSALLTTSDINITAAAIALSIGMSVFITATRRK